VGPCSQATASGAAPRARGLRGSSHPAGARSLALGGADDHGRTVNVRVLVRGL